LEMTGYIDLVIKRMQARTDDKKKVATQEAALVRLQRVMKARLSSESTAGHAEAFDTMLDDDEALLRLMHGVDKDVGEGKGRNGAISMEELLGSLQLTAEMKKALMAVFACSLEVAEKVLAHVDAEELGKDKEKEEGAQGASGSAFDSKAAVKALFDALDPTGSGWAKKEDLNEYAIKLQNSGKLKLAKALMDLAEPLHYAKDELDFLDLKREARRVPRVTGPRIGWARRTGLDASLARHLPPGTLEDGLAGVRGMPLGEAKRAVDAFLEDARVRILTALVGTKTAKGSKSAAEANSKFAGGFQGSFATLGEFHKGAAETLNLGYPNPDGMKGICFELTQHPSAMRLFKTPNYSIVTNMLLEYAFAVYNTNPDNRERDVLDRSRKFILKLVEEREGAEAASAAAKRVERPLFPGEVGDSFAESLVILMFPATSLSLPKEDKTLGDRAREGAAKFLDTCTLVTSEEKVRGVGWPIFDQKACLQRMSKARSVLQQHGQTSQVRDEVSRCVGLLLPMPLARAQALLEALQAKVAASLGIEGVAAKVEGCKTWTFSRFTGVEELRKWLGEQSLETLEQEVQDNKWPNVPRDAQRESQEQLCKALVDSFVLTELQADLRAALESASDAQILALLKGWNQDPKGERWDWLNQAAAVLDSEEWEKRWGEVEGWVRLHRGRIQGRTQVGLKALMEKEKVKIEKCNLTAAEVLAGNIYTGASFVPLNAICRNFPRNILDLLKGTEVIPDNKMCTTLFCISSCLKKLSKFTTLPDNRCPLSTSRRVRWAHPAITLGNMGGAQSNLSFQSNLSHPILFSRFPLPPHSLSPSSKVYRGLGTMLLPSEFWVPQGDPAWCGGVERALMSTTADMDVALHYANGKGTVVEIDIGRIQTGGDVSFLSMVSAPNTLAHQRRWPMPP
jgi:hypothetical protein